MSRSSLALALLLGGCVAGFAARYTWTRSGATDAEIAHDEYVCQREVIRAREGPSDPTAEARYVACMTARGYRPR